MVTKSKYELFEILAFCRIHFYVLEGYFKEPVDYRWSEEKFAKIALQSTYTAKEVESIFYRWLDDIEKKYQAEKMINRERVSLAVTSELLDIRNVYRSTHKKKYDKRMKKYLLEYSRCTGLLTYDEFSQAADELWEQAYPQPEAK